MHTLHTTYIYRTSCLDAAISIEHICHLCRCTICLVQSYPSFRSPVRPLASSIALPSFLPYTHPSVHAPIDASTHLPFPGATSARERAQWAVARATRQTAGMRSEANKANSVHGAVVVVVMRGMRRTASRCDCIPFVAPVHSQKAV
jgi:hypothetical protein